MKNLIVWVEDRPDMVLTQKGFLEKRGFEVKFVATPNRLADLLKKEKDRTALIILDVMLFGVQSLKHWDPASSTEGGYVAGWLIASSSLRKDYKEIPILFVSARPFNSECEDKLKKIRDLGGAWVEYIEKGSVTGDTDWTRKFEEIIESKLTEKKS